MSVVTLLKPCTRCGMVTAIALTAAACGSNSSPTSPSSPPPSIAALVIRGAPALLVVGETATLTVEATWSDGASRPLTPQWTTDAAEVASIENGVLIARGAGIATVSAISGVSHGTARVRVVPALAGTWSGSVRYPSCSVPARWGSAFCPSPTVSYAMDLQLVQQGDTVIGTLDFGPTGAVTGTIAPDGTLVLSGQLTRRVSSRTTRYDLRDWHSSIAADGSMRGRWAEVATWDGEAGEGLIQGEIIRVVRQ